MKFNVDITLRHVSGPRQDEDTMIDAFAAKIGRQNTAKPPLVITTSDGDGGEESVYEVELVSD